MSCKGGFVAGLVVSVLLGAQGEGALAQSSAGGSEREPEAASTAPVYRESALRRMEIITFVSLPFTAIHSYLIVRSVRMIQEGSVAAGLSGNDWTYVGIGAAALSVGIALYDWNRLRGKDRNEPLLPETPSERSVAERTRTESRFQRPWLFVRVRF